MAGYSYDGPARVTSTRAVVLEADGGRDLAGTVAGLCPRSGRAHRLRLTAQVTGEGEPPAPQALLDDAEKAALVVALRRTMSDLSQTCWAAGWIAGCEHDVWALLAGDRTAWGTCDDVDGQWDGYVRQGLEACGALSRLLGVWLAWDDDAGDAVPVPLDEWRRRHAAAGHRRAPAPDG